MSSLTLNGDTSGSILIQAPAVAGSGTLTLPTGTATLATQGPAFSAYINSNQTVSSATNTKLAFDVEEWDTASCYDTTNYRFTPTVAGYYFVIGNANPYNSGAPLRTIIKLYKNGALYRILFDINFSSSSYGFNNGFQGSAMVYLNGTTDYIEIFGYLTVASGTPQWQGGTSTVSQFSACLLRGA